MNRSKFVRILCIILAIIMALSLLASVLPIIARADDETDDDFEEQLALLNQQKEEAKMRANLRVGDELTTIGGIKGRVVSIKDDTVTIETSNDRTKIVFVKDAIGTVHTKHEDPIDDDDDDDDDDI